MVLLLAILDVASRLVKAYTHATIICYAARMNELAVDREAIAYHGKRLEYFTIAWNSLEGLIGIGVGVIAGSISLVGFGIDSLIEVTSGATLLWRMSAALAAYVTYEAVLVLIWRSAPQHSIPGIVLACISLIVMPILSRAKKRVGDALGSAAMHADARQTSSTFLFSISCVESTAAHRQ